MDQEAIRQGVAYSLPMISEIKSKELRNQVLDAWTLALSKNGYTRIEEIEGSGKPGVIQWEIRPSIYSASPGLLWRWPRL